MKLRPSAACAALALGALLPAAARAQSTDAHVLPFGTFRLGVEGSHATFDSRFDASGNRVDVGAGLAGELGPDRLSTLQPLAGLLGEFLDATAGGPGAATDPLDPESISLGLLDVAATESRTEALARFSVGILPRLEFGAALPISRGDRILHRLGLAGGNLGVNPDVAGNRELLATIGWGPLGDAALLPTGESPLGIELQNRVTAITGQPLALPTDTADLTLLQAMLVEQYGVPELQSGVERWRLGDLELNARALLLSTFADAPVPIAPSGMHLRVAITGAARFATGEQPDTLHLLAPEPTEGLSSVGAGGVADVFLGSRFWLTGALGFTWSRATEVLRRVAPRDAPLSVPAGAGPVSYQPGNRVAFSFAPRYRLAESISLGAEYALVNVGDGEFSAGAGGENASVLNLAGGNLQRLGLGIRYSSLPAHRVGRARLPIEGSLEYRRALSGPEGAAAGGVVTVGVSVLPDLW